MTKSLATLLFIAITLGIMGAIGWLFSQYGWEYAAGVLSATVFWEVVHRLSKGHWFTG